LKLVKKIFFVLFIWVFIACENDVNEVRNYFKSKNVPTETTINATILYSDSGVVTARLKAPRIQHILNEKKSFTVFSKGIKINFFESADTLNTTNMTANYAIKYDDEDVMEGRGNVIIVNNKGDKLNTEHIVWNQKTQKIESDVFVKITTATEILIGYGLESNQDFTKYKIKKIKGILSIKE
jgi:LPS export ABC transporter protein LptC